MAGKLSGNAIANGTVTTTQLAADVSAVIAQGGGPKVTSVAYGGGALAAANDGISTVIVTGTGFNPGVTVYINGIVSPSVTRANANSLTFVVPTGAPATGVVPFYVYNTDGGGAIYLPGITMSGTPTWLTGADLGSVQSNVAVSLPPLFAYVEGDITPIYATGGTVANINNYTIHTFTTTSSFNVSSGGGTIEYLLVAAGGGGGNDMGGGGGGGGVLANTTTVTATNYTITIGAGGSGGTGYAATPPAGANGGNTSFGNTIIAVGGGGGGSGHRTDAPYVGGNAAIGGSGGGSAARYRYSGAPQSLGANAIAIPSWQRGTRGGHSPETQVSDQYYAGGGGGAGGNTSLAGMANGTIDAVSGTRAGHGGDGYSSNISGTSYYYAGGGGGANHTAGTAGKGGYGGGGGGSSWGAPAGIGGLGGIANGASGGSAGGATVGGAGANNTGGGGGGGNHQGNGGAGGSGIVYIKYPKNDTIASNLTYSVVSGSLPPGVSMNSKGYITGTSPNLNVTTTYSFTVSAGPDAEGQYSQKTFSITVLRPSLLATGGTVSNVGSYRIHTFTSSDNFIVTANPNSINVEYLVVAGGGGGGGWGGGGGAGGVLTGSILPNVATYAITIGSGGARGTQSYTGGGNGTHSSFIQTPAGIVVANSVGGGGGGWYNGNAGSAGGSGGGGGMAESSSAPGGAGTPGQGYAGGAGSPNIGGWTSGRGGGGGGAANVGYTGVVSTAGATNAGRGGDGILSPISGTATYYGGGGGGHSGYGMPAASAPGLGIGGAGGGGSGGRYGGSNPLGLSGVAAGDGTTNTGGGGGGAYGGPGELCGLGGSGIVIIRYLVT